MSLDSVHDNVENVSVLKQSTKLLMGTEHDDSVHDNVYIVE